MIPTFQSFHQLSGLSVLITKIPERKEKDMISLLPFVTYSRFVTYLVIFSKYVLDVEHQMWVSVDPLGFHNHR